jgi:hypothetical protein
LLTSGWRADSIDVMKSVEMSYGALLSREADRFGLLLGLLLLSVRVGPSAG